MEHATMEHVESALTSASTVSPAITALFGLILVLMIVCLAAEEKLHAQKSVIVGVFAIMSLFLASVLGLVPFGDVTIAGGHHIEMPVYIPAIDWKVISIIVGSSVFVDVTSKSGLFSWIAIMLTKASKGDPLKLLWSYGLMTVVFSAVLNNVTAMIIVGSLTVVSLEKLGKTQMLLAFLLIEGLLTNIGGLLTLISSVPNIIIGGTAGISFVTFFIKSAPYVVVATAATIFMGAKMFKINALKTEAEKAEAAHLIESFDENSAIESKAFFWFSVAALVAFILTIATTSILPIVKDLGMGFVALAFAMLMLIRYKSEADEFYRAIDWDLIGFFMALFVVISVMEHAHVLDAIGAGVQFMIGEGQSAFGTGALLISSAVFSSVTDNIPLAAMLAKILASLDTASDSALWWSVVFGANLGGNLTPIGSEYNIVEIQLALNIVRQRGNHGNVP